MIHPIARAVLPLLVAVVIALLPSPGLPQHAWYYFAIFAGVIVGLILEPLPGGAVGIIGVTVVTVLSPFVLFSPADLAKPGFSAPSASLTWALSGFSNTTVWLIFGAFMFALGYEKTGLGRRLALLLVKWMGYRTLTLGYAIVLADLALAPFTPSNTARSAGTIYPVLQNLPPLYQSQPNHRSSRRIGSYIMWVAIAATSVTSSMFLTALAPNLLAMELAQKTHHVSVNWTQWFIAFLPVGVVLLLVVPLLTYWIYPPEVKSGHEVPQWAANELLTLGKLTRHELTLIGLVVTALVLWIFATDWLSPTTVALIVISLMLMTGVVRWDDMLADKPAWNTLAWFATLVALADGLARVGFVKWFADMVAVHMAGFSPLMAMMGLVTVFFVIHYLFASITAHVTALLPVMLAVGSTMPGINMQQLVLVLSLTFGLMGILTPYASGPNPVYYGSGYLPSRDWWPLGAVFGLVYLVVYLAIGVPWAMHVVQ